MKYLSYKRYEAAVSRHESFKMNGHRKTPVHGATEIFIYLNGLILQMILLQVSRFIIMINGHFLKRHQIFHIFNQHKHIFETRCYSQGNISHQFSKVYIKTVMEVCAINLLSQYRTVYQYIVDETCSLGRQGICFRDPSKEGIFS